MRPSLTLAAAVALAALLCGPAVADWFAPLPEGMHAILATVQKYDAAKGDLVVKVYGWLEPWKEHPGTGSGFNPGQKMNGSAEGRLWGETLQVTLPKKDMRKAAGGDEQGIGDHLVT